MRIIAFKSKVSNKVPKQLQGIQVTTNEESAVANLFLGMSCGAWDGAQGRWFCFLCQIMVEWSNGGNAE